jgi:hypothetical protein
MLGQEGLNLFVCRPLADLADVFQAAQRTEYHDRERLPHAAKVAVVFFRSLNIRKIFSDSGYFIHTAILAIWGYFEN